MGKYWKHLLGIGLSIILMAGICACSNENDWVFSLNGESIYDKDVTLFGLIYAREYNIHDADSLKETNEAGETYAEYYKTLLEEQIVKTVLFYKEAKTENLALEKRDEEKVEEDTQAFIEWIGTDYLEKRDISEKDVKHIYEMKYMANLYEESNLADQANTEEERYVKVLQVTFPTVELDENGMMQADENGNCKKISAVQITKRREAAEAFSQSARDGEDFDTLLKDCDKTVTNVEKYLKYDDLDEEYKKQMDKLSNGEISEVIAADYGFYVVKLLEKDSKDYADVLKNYEEKNAEQNEQEEKWSKLYNKYVNNNREYKNEEKWERVSMSDFVR